MELKSVEWVIGQGIGAVLALTMFLIYRKDVHNALNSWQAQTKILTDLVREVSVAMTSNTKAVESNTTAVGAMEAILPHACPMAEQVAAGSVEVVRQARGAR